MSRRKQQLTRKGMKVAHCRKISFHGINGGGLRGAVCQNIVPPSPFCDPVGEMPVMKPYYEHAGITIYHGDCRDVLPQLKADAVITDPPYNCGKDYGVFKDNLSDAEYREFMETVIKYSFAAAPNQAWVAPRYKLEFFLPLFPGYHLVIIRRGACGPLRHGWADQYETLITVGRPKHAPSDLWDGIRLKGEGYFFRENTHGHPGYTPYPIIARAAHLLAEKIILDPFCGTGTALRAAKDLGIRGIGIEINEAYCEIAAKRMAQEVLFGAPEIAEAEQTGTQQPHAVRAESAHTETGTSA